MILRPLFIPAASVVKVDETPAQAQPTSNECLCKPSELPIYVKEPFKSINQSEVCIPPEPGAVENTIGKVRRAVFRLMAEAKSLESTGEAWLEEGLDNAECLISYLQEEDNTMPKFGAVAVGALTGLILGLRGRFFRRTLYASMGGLSMAAICYPNEASKFSQMGLVEGRRYATILYNFIYGVKKDDPPLELPALPKLPTSLSEVWDVAKNIGKSSEPPVAGKVKAETEKVIVEPPVELPVEPIPVPESEPTCQCPNKACLIQHEESSPCDHDPDNSENDPTVPIENPDKGYDSSSHFINMSIATECVTAPKL